MPWLLKTEPSTYSAQDLQREKKAVWDGISNAAALKNLRAMARGDEVLIYHTGDERACVAIAQVSTAAYPDPKAEDEKQVVVELKFKSMLKNPVTLAQIKADKTFAGWELLRIGRLSVVPTPQDLWKRVLALSTAAAGK